MNVKRRFGILEIDWCRTKILYLYILKLYFDRFMLSTEQTFPECSVHQSVSHWVKENWALYLAVYEGCIFSLNSTFVYFVSLYIYNWGWWPPCHFHTSSLVCQQTVKSNGGEGKRSKDEQGLARSSYLKKKLSKVLWQKLSDLFFAD